MRIKYGNHLSGVQEAWFETSERAILAQTGVRVVRRVNWTLHYVLQASTQSDLMDEVSSLEAAYSRDGQDLRIMLDDGVTATPHALLNSNTVNGVRIVGRPQYPGYFKGVWGQKTEGFNLRYAVIRATADLIDNEGNIVFYHQSVSQRGFGGRRFVIGESFRGRPKRYDTTLYSGFRAVQRGKAIGLFTNPQAVAPIWPYSIDEDREPEITKESPQQQGGVRNIYFPTTWRYEYKAGTSLLAVPPPIYA